MKVYDLIMLGFFVLVIINGMFFGEAFLRLPFRTRLLIGTGVFLPFATWIVIGKLING